MMLIYGDVREAKLFKTAKANGINPMYYLQLLYMLIADLSNQEILEVIMLWSKKFLEIIKIKS